MLGKRRSLIVMAAALLPVMAMAELQNVQIGGKIEIYGAWYSDWYEESGAALRIPSTFLPWRTIGAAGTFSGIRAGDGGNDLTWVEQRTRLHVAADFTNEVSAFIEIDSIDSWGEDFRSNHLTGVDTRANTSDDVELYQAYIEVSRLFGLPLSLRIGRQEIEFGSGWLMGSDPGPNPFVGMSHDAIRLNYGTDEFCVNAWWSKIAEQSPIEEDGDADFYGIYASFHKKGAEVVGKAPQLRDCIFPINLMYYTFWRSGPFQGRRPPSTEELTCDLYWMVLRDAASRNDTNMPAPAEWIEDLFGVDNYDVSMLNTVGTRGAGIWNRTDWEIEIAYQWGEADAVGALFVPLGGRYGDNRARWDTWGGHAEVGYTFDWRLKPRIFVGGAYYGGEDNRGTSFADWLNPFNRPKASVSFNRLFTSWREDAFIDISGMSNFWKAHIGATASATEAVEIGASLAYYEAIGAFDNPVTIKLGSWRIPVAPALSFWTEENSKDLGWELSLWATYHYSEDLTFEVSWTHIFVGDAIGDGVVFANDNGLTNIGGRGQDDADIIDFLTTLNF